MDATVGSPNFSRLLPCTCKLDEQRSRAQQKMRQFSDLTVLRDLTFESFDPTVRGTEEAFEAALAFARHPDRWLVLVGDYGCGKTHLAAAIANYTLYHKQMNPIFAVTPDLLDYLRTTFGPDSDASYDERFNAFRGADLLILDDLGAELDRNAEASRHVRDETLGLIGDRIESGKGTVITTNEPFAVLELMLGERVISRIQQQGRQEVIEHPDRRRAHVTQKWL